MSVLPGLQALQCEVCVTVGWENLLFVGELQQVYTSSVLCMTSFKKLMLWEMTSENEFPKFLYFHFKDYFSSTLGFLFSR